MPARLAFWLRPQAHMQPWAALRVRGQPRGGCMGQTPAEHTGKARRPPPALSASAWAHASRKRGGGGARSGGGFQQLQPVTKAPALRPRNKQLRSRPGRESELLILFARFLHPRAAPPPARSRSLRSRRQGRACGCRLAVLAVLAVLAGEHPHTPPARGQRGMTTGYLGKWRVPKFGGCQMAHDGAKAGPAPGIVKLQCVKRNTGACMARLRLAALWRRAAWEADGIRGAGIFTGSCVPLGVAWKGLLERKNLMPVPPWPQLGQASMASPPVGSVAQGISARRIDTSFRLGCLMRFMELCQLLCMLGSQAFPGSPRAHIKVGLRHQRGGMVRFALPSLRRLSCEV
ncbi:uncharacterized protein VTP21DRAFT_176 [Calcarisporiella thermophila]|uniref:uncharacterized protein n=1 Tax=Calcarisporiella thermophila TaxID=911321 RepID=UPI003743CEDF